MSAPSRRACERAGGAQDGRQDLIHRKNCSNPVSMRVSGRFEGPNLPLWLLDAGCPAAVAWLAGWRAGQEGSRDAKFTR